MLREYLNVTPGITAAIGSGGKTSLLEKLAEELSREGTVIFCTTTHIAPPPYPVLDPAEAELPALVRKHSVLCAATPAEGGKLQAPTLSPEQLARFADYVLVEADGSRRLPIKAHDLTREPVIPEQCKTLIHVIGASGFGQPIEAVCHRPERFCALTGAAPADPVTPELVAEVLRRENLGGTVFLNQVDNPSRISIAGELAAALKKPIIAGSLQKEWYTCLF